MAHFVLRLIPPRPTFAQDMNAEERAIMAAHAQYWQPQIQAGKMVIFGPVLDQTGSWGLAVLEAEGEEAALALTSEDPAVTSGLAHYKAGRMLAGFVRPSGS